MCSSDYSLVPLHFDGAFNVALEANIKSVLLQKKSYTGRPSVFISNVICEGFFFSSNMIIESLRYCNPME